MKNRLATIIGILTFSHVVMFVSLCAGQDMSTPSRLPDEQTGVQLLRSNDLLPGAIGAQRMYRGGPLLGYFQPVELRLPVGTRVAPASGGQFMIPQEGPVLLGMQIGKVYRLRVTNIPTTEDAEVFPTVEIIDRTYPPQGEELKFPIPISIEMADLLFAIQGKFVTRVVYLEDPDQATDYPERDGQVNWIDVAPTMNPLTVAETLGRPVAIIRLGGRTPQDTAKPSAQFLYNAPQFQYFPKTGQIPIASYFNGATTRSATQASYQSH